MEGESDPPDADSRIEPSSAGSRVVLRQHRLSHLPGLEVSWSLIETRYAPGCSLGSCDATCCRSGVKVDVAQRDQILAHADLIRRAMDPGQDHDVSGWFEDTEITDPDFPSDRCVSTQVRDNGCVFLDSAGRCVLQTVTIAAARPGFDLKPFFCTAFPITIDTGVLWIDEMCLDAPVGCCRPTVGGALSVLDVCEAELRHVLGSEGIEELRLVAKEYLS